MQSPAERRGEVARRSRPGPRRQEMRSGQRIRRSQRIWPGREAPRGKTPRGARLRQRAPGQQAERHRTRSQAGSSGRGASRPRVIAPGASRHGAGVPAAHHPSGRPAADPAHLLPGRGRGGDLAAGHLPGRPAAVHAGLGRVRVGLLVDGAAGQPPGRPMVHQPHGRARGGPARVPHADAAAGPAADPRHADLRAQCLVQPAGHRGARAAVLRHVPGGAAVAAQPDRCDRGRGVLRPVGDARPGRLVPRQHRGGGTVPPAGPGGVGAAAPVPRLAPRRRPRSSGGRGRAHRPGIGRADRHPDRAGPAALAVVASLGDPVVARRAGRRGRRGRGRPAARRDDPRTGPGRTADRHPDCSG